MFSILLICTGIITILGVALFINYLLNRHVHEYLAIKTVPVNIIKFDDSRDSGYCQLQACKGCKKERAILIKYHMNYEINLDYAKLEFFK